MSPITISLWLITASIYKFVSTYELKLTMKQHILSWNCYCLTYNFYFNWLSLWFKYLLDDYVTCMSCISVVLHVILGTVQLLCLSYESIIFFFFSSLSFLSWHSTCFSVIITLSFLLRLIWEVLPVLKFHGPYFRMCTLCLRLFFVPCIQIFLRYIHFFAFSYFTMLYKVFKSWLMFSIGQTFLVF